MRNILLLATLVFCVVFVTTDAAAQATAQQTLTLAVQAVQKISVTGDPAAMTLSVIAAAGDSAYTPATNNVTKYSITQNVGPSRITAQLDANMPANLKLEIALASTKGTSAGTVDISSSAGAAQNVVTAIGLGADKDQTITYTFSGTTGAGTFSGSRQVTLTLVNP
jgi:hypothetical protein